MSILQSSGVKHIHVSFFFGGGGVLLQLANKHCLYLQMCAISCLNVGVVFNRR